MPLHRYLIVENPNDDDDIIGWGDGPGFDIIPLGGLNITYPPIGGTSNQPVAIIMNIDRPGRVYSLDMRPPKGSSSSFFPLLLTLPPDTVYSVRQAFILSPYPLQYNALQIAVRTDRDGSVWVAYRSLYSSRDQ